MVAMVSLALPPQAPIRVIPDVHGELADFARLVAEARRQGRFILQLGDVVDRGPDSAGALQVMLDLIDEGAGLMLMGNHEWKIQRALMGRPVKMNAEAQRTLLEIAEVPGLGARFMDAFAKMPLYARHGSRLFVHGAWDPAMTDEAALDARDHDRLLARALYGQTTGKLDPKGRPERVWDWVDAIPRGLEVVVGHDWRGPSVILRRQGALGGSVTLMDLGAGKGGPLAHMDIEDDGRARYSHPTAHWQGAVYQLADAS
jgi:protein phosphatase